MSLSTEIINRVADRMTADILSRPRIARSPTDRAYADVQQRLYRLASAATPSTRPALLTRRDPDWERYAAMIDELHAELLCLRVQRALDEVSR